MSGVEIRTYEGDFEDVAALIARTWRFNFTGKTWFPMWNAAYFRWRLGDPRSGPRDFHIGAYQGGKLVGCVLAECFDLEARGAKTKATYSSFLTVDPELKTPGVAIRLLEALRRRHQEHGVAISLGVTSTDPTLPNRKFWDALAKRKPEDIRVLGAIKMWARILDGKALSESGLTAFERVGGRLAELIPSFGARSEARDYAPADLARCLEWMEAQSRGADLRMVWSPARLELQLAHPHVRTLVDEEAFINWYPVDWYAGGPLRVGMIDLFAGPSPRASLVKAAVERMKAEGLHIAMMWSTAASPSAPLLTAGFVPYPPGAEYIAVFPLLDTGANPSLHLLFT